MVASSQMARTFRSSRIPDLILLVGCLLLLPPRDARGAAEIVATRLLPSSRSAQYGPAVGVNVSPPGGSFGLVMARDDHAVGV